MTLLVIGASSDMGMGLIRLTKDRYDIILAHYFHMNERLEALKIELGDKLILLQADLSKLEEVERLIRSVLRASEYPSHIVHFPAIKCTNAKFHKIKWDVFQSEYDVSIRSAVMILQAFLPQMAKAHYGRIVIMLSYVVNGPAPAYCANYVVTKYGLLGLLKSIATEYASKGITINGVSPAWVNTKYIDNQPDVLKEQNASKSPLGRNLEVEEIVPTIEYLLSDGASCITGENLTISCGK